MSAPASVHTEQAPAPVTPVPAFRFRQQMRDDLAAKGSSAIAVAPEHASLARSIARAIGRDLGRPVQTAVSSSGPLTVTVWLADWPATVEEGIRHAENQRAAAAAA